MIVDVHALREAWLRTSNGYICCYYGYGTPI